MGKLEIEILEAEELLSVKGGYWLYDPDHDEWYWIEGKSLDDPFSTKDK